MLGRIWQNKAKIPEGKKVEYSVAFRNGKLILLWLLYQQFYEYSCHILKEIGGDNTVHM